MLQDIEAATMVVAVGQWPKTPADEKKCATFITTFKMFNLFESNGAKKPPQALAASIYGDLDTAFAYFGGPQLFGLGAVDSVATIACALWTRRDRDLEVDFRPGRG
jgi:hypothetical protein